MPVTATVLGEELESDGSARRRVFSVWFEKERRVEPSEGRIYQHATDGDELGSQEGKLTTSSVVTSSSSSIPFFFPASSS
jgi:hypothetical protein